MNYRTPRRLFISISTSFLVFNAVCFAQGLGDTTFLIDKIFAQWNEKTPGGVLQISRSGQTIYHRAFGMSNLEDNIRNNTETVFEAGSVSKQFTAAAALLLVQEGRINFTDNIRKYFPDFPQYGEAITIDHLFNHTSGLRDWGSVAEIGGWPRGSRVYTPAHVRSIIWRQTKTNFTPGTRYSYSNSNYSMLVFLVEKVSGKTLQSFTSERLFKPLGMTKTRWRDNFRQVVPGRAQAYSNSFNQPALNMPFENTFGHGALLTTTDDLTRWNLHWKNNILGENFNRMQKEKGKLMNGKAISYARGVVAGEYNKQEEISHSGATAGYRAWLAWYPGKDLSVAFLCNDGNHNPAATGNKVAEIFLGKEIPARKDSTAIIAFEKEWAEPKSGVYKATDRDDIIELQWKDNKLAMKNGSSLQPVSQHSFLYNLNRIDFQENGKTDFFTLAFPNGDTATYKKVTPYSNNEEKLKAYTGKYISEEADARVNIAIENGRLIITADPDRRYLLTPQFMDAFHVSGQQLIQFHRKKKIITGFSWSVARAQGLWFQKIRE